MDLSMMLLHNVLVEVWQKPVSTGTVETGLSRCLNRRWRKLASPGLCVLLVGVTGRLAEFIVSGKW